jgi:hypothetical protein
MDSIKKWLPPSRYFSNAISGDCHTSSITLRPRKDIGECLEEHATRNMTSDADALNACLGILGACRADTLYQIKGHLWGVVISQQASTMHLHQWYHSRPAHRRPDFPSWSWVGWKGPFHHWDPERDSRNRVRIHILHDTSQFLPVEKYIGVSGADFLDAQVKPTTAPRILQLTGFCPSFRIIDYEPPQDVTANPIYSSIHCALLPLSEKVAQYCQVSQDCDRTTVGELSDCIAMLLEDFEIDNPGAPRRMYILLLLKPIGNTYQRVGLLSVGSYFASCDQFGTYRQCRQNGDINNSEHRDIDDLWPPGSEPPWLQNATERTVVLE